MASNRRRHPAAPAGSNDLVARLHNTSINAPPRQLQGLPDFNIPDGAHLDSSSSESDIHPSRPRRPPHSRSMSHPFPSLFSSKKKRQSPPDSSDDDSPVTRPAAHLAPSRGHTRGNMSVGAPDFATGHCMTCNALVRWPRELKVFKCTVCVTINDVRPEDLPHLRHESGPRWLRGHAQAKPLPPTPSHPPPTQTAGSNSGPSLPVERPQVKELTVEHTSSLVRQCLRTHLARVLQKAGRIQPEPAQGASEMQTLSGSLAAPNSTKAIWKATGDSPARFVFSEAPTLRPDPCRTPSASLRSYSASYPERPPVQGLLRDTPAGASFNHHENQAEIDPKRVFRPLEDHIVAAFSSFECINSSFLVRRPSLAVPPTGPARRPSTTVRQEAKSPDTNVFDLDPKLLLLGDVAENGMWWTGDQADGREAAKSDQRRSGRQPPQFVSTRSPQIDWSQLNTWYQVVINAAENWTSVYDDLYHQAPFDSLTPGELDAIEAGLLTAQDHLQRLLLKATETLLKRPGRPMAEPDDIRFLFIILENPLLHANAQYFRGSSRDPEKSVHREQVNAKKTPARGGPVAGQHSGIIKRVIGLLSNSSSICQTHAISWFARLSQPAFVRSKDLVGGFLTYRMIRQNGKKHESKVDVISGLIPSMGVGDSAASLHAALGISSRSSKQSKKQQPEKPIYHEDWQIRAASRVLALLFAANNSHVKRLDASGEEQHVPALRGGIHAQGQRLPTSDFYNSMIDYADLIADFEAWEAKRGKFAFCQYPFLLSMWAKSQILEHDASRQMTRKARDAFFDSIMTSKKATQYLTLDIRRDCLVEDSLTSVSEVIGSGSEDIKKRLRIVFKGEEGYDAGGLRKEWFLLLVREVFNPDHGLFLYDEDSQFCYFNPNSFETSDQFFLVGVVLGLAIYNSTILDVALPPFAYRKLLTAAPIAPAANSNHPRPQMVYHLEDLAEYRPRLAAGLKQLLDFEGDVEATFGLDFVVSLERYGAVVEIPLCPGGERKSVTSSNRKDYVDLYVRYLLDSAVSRQFEPFKRGFYTVCGGNAFSLFRPEEIELLVRGSDAALDVDSLRGVAEYDNWGTKKPDGTEPVIEWFWDTFKQASAPDQRKLLSFITGSDRVPAMGATLLPIKISCLGDDEDRFPIARTCFNMLSLRRYRSKERLERMLWTAVYESEGFGLK